MSKAKRKAREATRKANAMARPLTISRLEGRDAREGVAKRLKSEQRHGTNVPARVVERTGMSTVGVRLSDGADVAKIRPKRRARNMGSEAVAAGLTGRAYGSRGGKGAQLTAAEIEENRARFFAGVKARRKADRKREAESVVVVDADARRIADAQADYRHAIDQSRARADAGDTSGAEAWMGKAREYRRIFRNK